MPQPAFKTLIQTTLPHLQNADWVPLTGGRTNQLWRVADCAVKRYDPRATSPLFPNDARAEAIALRHFGPIGLAPTLYAAGPDWIVYRHVEGHAWRNDVLPVAQMLARLHQTPRPFPLIRKLDTEIHALRLQTAHLISIANLDLPLPEVASAPMIEACVLHGDAVAGNIIVGPQGLRLIDWQCPAIGDPTEDLAAFLSPAMQTIYRGAPLGASDVKAFLRAYPDPTVTERYRALRPLYRLRMAAHCMWRAARGDAGYSAAAQAELAG